jgi:leader peptidase (prepilin peptidase) / N-methyltransferase
MLDSLSGFDGTILAAFGGIFGAIIGSFIAALCVRWPLGKSVLRGRSACDGCAKPLAFYQLLPIISFALQRGRCSACGGAIDKIHMMAEIGGAAIGIAAFAFFDPTQAIRFAALGWILLPLILLDIRHLWLPNILTGMFAVTALASGLMLEPGYPWAAHIIAACAAFALMEGLRLGYRAFRHQDGMGAGDPKLFAALALWVPPLHLPYLILLASAMGIGFGAWMMRGGRANQIKLPLGAFMALAAIALKLLAI